MIHTELYLAKLKDFTYDNEKIHTEVITRVANHILSPSWCLLSKAKQNHWSFYEYAHALMKEWELDFEYPFWIMQYATSTSVKYHKELERLRRLTKSKELYLICYERLKFKCHREIVKALLLGYTPNQILVNIQANGDRLIIED